MSQSFRPVKCLGYECYPPGEEPKSFKKGDFILTHGSAWTSKLIRFGQKLRFHGVDAKYTRWNHCALIINANGEIAEALGAGIKKTNISKYKQNEYFLVRIIASDEDREQAVAFALYSLEEKYGWITILSVAVCLLTGLKFSFGFDDEKICSGLVARAMERTWAIFNRTPSHITPADLAKYYNVDPTNQKEY